MADQHAIQNTVHPSSYARNPLQRFLIATELDTRLLGMVGALAIIWIGFHVFSGGLFLTPRNLWNLSVQTSSVAVMVTGMVLVIVTRNIDLSVGSILGLVAMVMGVMQTDILPNQLGLGLGHPLIWVLSLAVGLLTGVAIGALQGSIIAYLRVPAFIVTLGGYLVWRGAAWWVTMGRTVAPMDPTFQLMGGGPTGSVGAFWSWVVGLVACVAIIVGLYFGRRQRLRFNSRCARSGPRRRWPLSAVALPSPRSGWPMPIPGRCVLPPTTPRPMAWQSPRAGCSSRMALPFPC